jgi:hypothetical protein
VSGAGLQAAPARTKETTQTTTRVTNQVTTQVAASSRNETGGAFMGASLYGGSRPENLQFVASSVRQS